MVADRKPEVAVITGASAGVGRAELREFARRGAAIGLIARDKERLESAKREVEQHGGKAICLPVAVANADQVEQAAPQVEAELGPIDIWVNNRDDYHLRSVGGNPARRVQARHGGNLPGMRLGHHGCVEGNASLRPRHHLASRLRTGVSIHSSPIGLQWRETRRCRLHRLATLRAHSPREQSTPDGGSPARHEHPAVQLVPHQAAGTYPACATHL